MDFGLKGKVALITGGSKGIGKAAARALAREGATVALVARGAKELTEAAAEITKESGAQAKGFVADTGVDAAVKTMVADVIAAFGRIDILVNCAAAPGGQAPPPKLAQINDENFWGDVNVKVMGYLRTAREAAPHMARQGSGRIINVSGLAARQTGTMIGSIRNVSVAALTKNLADELGSQGITAVCVHPALTFTEKSVGVFAAQAKAQGISPEEIERRHGSRNLLGRMVRAEEVGDLICFLASPRSMAVNGESIACGGGAPGVIHY